MDDPSSITKNCYKYNQTISNHIESCDTNQRNACFYVWELSEPVRTKNLTKIINSSIISLKGKIFVCVCVCAFLN